AVQRVGTSDKGLVIESRTGHKLADKDKRGTIGKLAGLLVLTGADGRIDALNVEAEPGPVPVSSVTLEAGAIDGGLAQILMFAVGLNLSGLYEFGGARVANLGGGLTRKDGATGSFFTGVLAVVVATPCTAPFMGAAMGYALTADARTALIIFTALGLGFAA